VAEDFDPIAFLRDQGVDDEQISRAVDEGWLPMLVVDRYVRPGERVYTKDDVARLGGLRIGLAERLWRALGFPDVPPEVPLFNDTDVGVLTMVRERLDLDDDPDRYIEQARVISAATSRVAELYTDALVRLADDALDGGLSPEEIAAAVPQNLDLDVIASVIDYVLRHQLVASMWRRLASRIDTDLVEQTIGFADLVGYTAMSQELTADELTRLVSTFESVSADAIAAAGGQIVKRIGDAVMFSVGDPTTGLMLALDLVEALEGEGLMVRIGLAHGPVVPHQGDLFGTPVNLASRVQSMARPGSVVISEAIYEAVGDRDDVRLRPMGRRRVKDLGPQRLWRARRRSSPDEDDVLVTTGVDEDIVPAAPDDDPGATRSDVTDVSDVSDVTDQGSLFDDESPGDAPTGTAIDAGVEPTVVYTDGACSGNPGPGGWAWAVEGGRWASGAESPSTNQRMEIMAAYDAVRSLDGPLVVVSDSTYVVHCFQDRWWRGWLRRGWVNAKKQPIANRDLWEPFIERVRDRDDVEFRWVKGHSGDPMNDLVDALAVQAATTGIGGSGALEP